MWGGNKVPPVCSISIDKMPPVSSLSIVSSVRKFKTEVLGLCHMFGCQFYMLIFTVLFKLSAGYF